MRAVAPRGAVASVGALLALCAALAWTPAEAADHSSGEATELTKDTFDEHVQGQLGAGTACLVMFHVDWCKVCIKTFPKFVAAASLVKKRGIGMSFAHVDCTDDKVLCQRYEVQGYPTIKLFAPGGDMAAPVKYRSQRTEEGFVKYAERMTRAPVLEVTSPEVFDNAVQGESFAAFVAVLDSPASAPPSFVAAAEEWRDRHVFAAAKSFADVLPKASLGGAPSSSGPKLAVIASGAQQWPGADRSAKASPAAEYFDGDVGDVAAVADWVKTHRFPGIWLLGDGNFYEFTHAGRRVVIVAVDPASVTKSEEKKLRGVSEKLRSQYIFGVVDAVAWSEELSAFNIKAPDLPRVIVTEQDFEAWYEDAEALTLDTLEQDLNALMTNSSDMLRQTPSGLSKLKFYKREGVRMSLWLYRYSQRGPKELGIASVLILGAIGLLFSLGLCVNSCCRMMFEDDDLGPSGSEQARGPRHTKRD